VTRVDLLVHLTIHGQRDAVEWYTLLKLKKPIGAIMSMASDMSKDARIMLAMEFVNVETSETLEIKVYEPSTVKHFSKTHNKWYESLRSDTKVVSRGTTSKEVFGGDSRTEILLIALEFIRTQIPEDEETIWVDSRGVPSWIVLPKTIPISWGYALHQKISGLVNSEIKKFTDEVQRKRLESEKNKN
jgi:hypothetical protein